MDTHVAKPQIIDFRIKENVALAASYSLLILTPINATMPEIKPGQFVEVHVPNSRTTYLRRPISVNYVDAGNQELWLLVRRAGNGTAALMQMRRDDSLNLILPLGNSFSSHMAHSLLIGGGVGVAPLLMQAEYLHNQGKQVEVILGARSKNDLLEVNLFQKYGKVYLSTEDGSAGEQGFVTQHSRLLHSNIQYIQCCGPEPMMKAVAQIARQHQIPCEVSLENTMACGIGACLCCVTDTVEHGNVCVCQEGPIFNINQLKW